MAVIWEIVGRLSRTRLGRTEREYLLVRFGKVIRSRWSLVREVIEKESSRLAAKALLVAGELVKEARRLYPRFAVRYDFVARLTEQEWAETVATVMAKGERVNLRGLRGVVVERLVPKMKEMEKLYADMVKLAKARKWRPPALVTGVRTLDGKELADLMIIAEHEDGRVWLMAIVESKSISNTADLIAHGEQPVGQHLWDLFRARSEGVRIEKFEHGGLTQTSYPPDKIVAAVAPPKPAGNELATRLIGIAPREFTSGELNRLAVQGVTIERWPWPVDDERLLKMLEELLATFAPE